MTRKKLFLIILFLIILLAALFWYVREKNLQSLKNNESTQEENTYNADIDLSDRQAVIQAAQDFLKKQDFADQYDLNSVKIENYSQFWNVWFDKKDKNQKPNKGLIQVNKENQEVRWMELS